MRELAADGIGVSLSCRVLGLCRQQYYRWLAVPVTTAEWDNALLANAVRIAHRDDPQFGYRFLVDEVRAAGFDPAERTVWPSARRTVGGPPSARNAAATPRRPAHPCTTTT